MREMIRVVHEAGYFGFWLYDRLVGYSVELHRNAAEFGSSGVWEPGDRRDSGKLAFLLARGMLRRVWVSNQHVTAGEPL
jgi:hypothetical protein